MKPLFYRMQAALQRFAPGICLVATLGATAWLHFGGDQRGHVVGFAQTTLEAIAPTEIARVISIGVSVGDEVAPGQIVAALDTSVIDAEIAVAEAEKARCEAEARAEQSVLAQQLDMDLEGLEREEARQRETQLQVSAEAKALDGEMSRIKWLVEDRQAVFGDLAQLALQRATVGALAAEKPRTLGLLAQQIKAAEQRRRTAKQEGSATAAKLAADLLVAERTVERLQQQRAGYVLRATQRGRVAMIEKQLGEIAGPVAPVVRLVSAGERVVACVPERVALGVREGDVARLWIRGQRGEALRGKTIALGPLVSELPARCWTSPKVPMWGREVTLALADPVDVLAGQAFDVVFELVAAPPPPPQLPSPSPPPLPPSSLAAGPLPMTVPPSLSKRTRFEPSGLVSDVRSGRYLVVSDDTGHEENAGEPWLFAMSAAGAVEPDPVRVDGVAELSDVEAIAAGDAGALYLLSSQSFSKKGKRKLARTALLRLRQDGRGFRVDGEVHLAELLDADPAQAAALGLPDGTRALDIEGLAFRQGSLYLGLKAPLDPQGNAMIWRIASPSALFAPQPDIVQAVEHEGQGALAWRRLADAGASLWGRVRVDVELAGRSTPGGISDLLFLPDGSLAISSTPSTADGDAGALWRVDAPAPSALAPLLVRRFPGLKPEGIAPSLSSGKLIIVFDAGGGAPSFQEVPWGP